HFSIAWHYLYDLRKWNDVSVHRIQHCFNKILCEKITFPNEGYILAMPNMVKKVMRVHYWCRLAGDCFLERKRYKISKENISFPLGISPFISKQKNVKLDPPERLFL